MILLPDGSINVQILLALCSGPRMPSGLSSAAAVAISCMLDNCAMILTSAARLAFASALHFRLVLLEDMAARFDLHSGEQVTFLLDGGTENGAPQITQYFVMSIRRDQTRMWDKLTYR